MSDSFQSSPLPLEYLTPVTPVNLPPARTHLAFKLAIACWIIPLLIGLSVFFLWLGFHWNWLFQWGWVVILGGTALAFIGGICALTLLCLRWSVSRRPFREAVLPAVCLVFLLASNFVVAFFLMMVVAQLGGFHHGM